MKQKLLTTMMLAVMLVFFGKGVWGQILTFEFSSLAGSEVSAPSNSNDANLTTSTITRGAGLTAAGNSGRFNATSWALTSIANAVSGDDYMEFTITPNSGYQFSVSSIYFQLQRSSTGPRGIALRNSLDNYAANLDQEYAIIDNTSTQNFTFTFAQSNSNVAVTYRVYMWAEAVAGSGGIGDGTGNDIVVYGTTSVSGGNTPPSITNIANTPTLPNSSQTVSVSADVTDTDGTISGVELHWGTVSGSLSTTIAMSVSSGDTYTTDTEIPAQAAETTIYYEIQATDDNSGVTTSSEQSYQVIANEPSGHVSGFTATANSGTTLTLTWIDSDAGNYLIKGSAVGYYDILAPVDGVTEANGALVQNVASGVQTYQFTGLTPSTSYYFMVYPYNGTGGAVDYKTDGTIPQQTATTLPLYFRSVASGVWNAFATWEISSDNSSWSASASEIPTYVNSDVTIQAGHVVTVPTGYYSGTAKNLTIESGATLYANSNTGSCFIYVYGDFLNDGTVGGATDVIGFDIEGSSCQLSGGGLFIASRIAKFTTTNSTTNFTIDQDVTLTYTSISAAALRNGAAATTFNMILGAGKQLTVPNAKIDLTGCTLTLKSDATGTASLIDNGTIDGMDGSNVAVERYITGGVWHDLSASTQNQTVNNLFFNHTPDVWLKSYNEADNTRIPITSLSTPLYSGAGFEIWVEAGNNVTVSFDGALKTSDVTLTTSSTPPLSYTGADPLGYNLIGNPFASPLDWDLGTWALTDMTDGIWIWNGSTYLDWVGGTGSLTDGIIPMGQGFFVQATSTAASITIPMDARVHSSQAYYKGPANVPDHMWIKAIKGEKNDQLTVVFADDATEGYDNGRDSRKMLAFSGNAPQIYAVEQDEKFGIDGLPTLTEAGRTVNMMYYVGESGEQQLMANLESLPDVTVLLEDLKTGAIQDLNENPEYLFEGQQGDDPNRFTLYFNPTATTINNLGDKSDIHVYAFENEIIIRSEGPAANTPKTIWVYDMYGRMILKTVIAPSTITKIPLDVKNAPVIVKVAGSGSVVTSKVFIN